MVIRLPSSSLLAAAALGNTAPTAAPAPGGRGNVQPVGPLMRWTGLPGGLIGKGNLAVTAARPDRIYALIQALAGVANQAAARLRDLRQRLAGRGDAALSARLDANADGLLTQPVRCGKPGLQAHITTWQAMTSRGDQKIGRDAVERYEALKKALDQVRTELEANVPR